MILIALMLMQAAYTPETEAVMNRSRAQAERTREEQARVKAREKQNASAAQAGGGGIPLPPEVAAKLQQCLDIAIDDPAAGVKFAQEWAIDRGGFSASQCRGFAEARAQHWDAAAGAFETASGEAQRVGATADAARLLAQAGNAALAGGNGTKARNYFDAALGYGLPDDVAKGEIYLDRARALVALGDAAGARADIDQALKLASEDPLIWLLSATLARRQDDLARARADMNEAKKRAPDDAAVALEDGNIAVLSGDDAAAKEAWQHAVTLAPDSPQARAAQESLAQLAGDTTKGAADEAAPSPPSVPAPAPADGGKESGR